MDEDFDDRVEAAIEKADSERKYSSQRRAELHLEVRGGSSVRLKGAGQWVPFAIDGEFVITFGDYDGQWLPIDAVLVEP